MLPIVSIPVFRAPRQQMLVMNVWLDLLSINLLINVYQLIVQVIVKSVLLLPSYLMGIVLLVIQVKLHAPDADQQISLNVYPASRVTTSNFPMILA